MRRVVRGLFSLAVVFSVSCTEAGDTTYVGAATGGVLGAGLGAVVGNQTGDTGSGLVIGAMAGAGTGAAIGNALEAQEKAIKTQDEAIERQEQTLAAQRSELAELRRSSQDSVTFGNSSQGGRGYPEPRARMGTYSPQVQRGMSPSRAIVESDISPPRASGAQTSTLNARELSPSAPLVNRQGDSYIAARAVPPLSARSTECVQAESEALSAERAGEAADKLFHLRRALRLCPDSAAYHNGLGEVYLQLGRKADAEFEFREALKLDPQFEPAITNLGNVHG